jgi:hypothetical protein
MAFGCEGWAIFAKMVKVRQDVHLCLVVSVVFRLNERPSMNALLSNGESP